MQPTSRAWCRGEGSRSNNPFLSHWYRTSRRLSITAKGDGTEGASRSGDVVGGQFVLEVCDDVSELRHETPLRPRPQPIPLQIQPSRTWQGRGVCWGIPVLNPKKTVVCHRTQELVPSIGDPQESTKFKARSRNRQLDCVYEVARTDISKTGSSGFTKLGT